MRNTHKEIIKDILAKLGVEQRTVVSNKTSNNDITEFENEYELSFPAAYREYLLMVSELSFDIDLAYTPIVNPPLSPNGGAMFFDGFYDLNDVIEATEDYAGRIPNVLIPIGDSYGGDLLCIGVGEDVVGKIYYWDHENELEGRLMVDMATHTDDIDSYWDNLSLVSNSFMDFLNGLKIEVREVTNEDVLADVKIWLADDLMKD